MLSGDPFPLSHFPALYFTREDKQMANSIWKDAQQHMSLGNCKLKPWVTTTTPIRMAKAKVLTSPNAGEDVERQELSFIAKWTQNGTMQNGTVTLEDSWAVPYKTKHTLTLPSSNCTPWYLLKWVETYVHTKTCTWMFIAALFIIVKLWNNSDVLQWVTG